MAHLFQKYLSKKLCKSAQHVWEDAVFCNILMKTIFPYSASDQYFLLVWCPISNEFLRAVMSQKNSSLILALPKYEMIERLLLLGLLLLLLAQFKIENFSLLRQKIFNFPETSHPRFSGSEHLIIILFRFLLRKRNCVFCFFALDRFNYRRR